MGPRSLPANIPVHDNYAPAWALKMTPGDGQAVLTGLVQYISTRHCPVCPRVHRPAVVLHPWQREYGRESVIEQKGPQSESGIAQTVSVTE